MLCDGRLVCGCADPYGRRTLGDIIQYNDEHPDQVKYGQNLLILSNAQIRELKRICREWRDEIPSWAALSTR